MRPRPKRKSAPATTTSVPIGRRTRSANASGSSWASSRSKSTTSVVLDPGLGEQLEPPLERRQQLDAVAERDPRMRVEGDDRRRRPGGERGVEHPPVPEVDAVEGPERDRPRLRLELARTPAGRRSQPRRAPPPAVSSRSGSASSTPNGPTSVRRSVAQCPPSAVAIARTYVPELTRRSSRATPSRVGDELERVDSRAAQRHLDRDAAPVQLVGALAADLHRRGGRDRQLDLAAQRRRAAPPAPPPPAARARATTAPSRSPVSVTDRRSTSVR